MWIPAALAVSLLTGLTGFDLYNQMRSQMVEIAEQVTGVTVGQLAAILTAAEQLLRSAEDRLREIDDVARLAQQPAALGAALEEVETIIHGTGFAGIAAIDRMGRIIGVASDDRLTDLDLLGNPVIERAFENRTFVLGEPIEPTTGEGGFAPLLYGVVAADNDDEGKSSPLFLLMTEIDVQFLDRFQSRLKSSLVKHVALLEQSGETIVGSWPFEDDRAHVDIRRGIGGFNFVAAAGFARSEIFHNVKSELLLLALTYLTSMLAITALSYAYACRAQVAEVLNQIVEQKDVLHREAQHRVSGALQLISSLVSLQAREAQNERVSQALETIKHRVAAILAVNGKLSGDVDGRQVDLGVYLQAICDDLAASFEQKQPSAQLDASLSSILCDGEKAVRLGLIVNELVTNAYRHGFGEGQPGTVVVRLSHDDERFQITVADDGVGLKDTSSGGIGLELVALLAEQLNCTIEQVPTDIGLTCRLDGPIGVLTPSSGS